MTMQFIQPLDSPLLHTHRLLSLLTCSAARTRYHRQGRLGAQVSFILKSPRRSQFDSDAQGPPKCSATEQQR